MQGMHAAPAGYGRDRHSEACAVALVRSPNDGLEYCRRGKISCHLRLDLVKHDCSWSDYATLTLPMIPFTHRLGTESWYSWLIMDFSQLNLI